MVSKALLTSNTDQWATPEYLFNGYNQVYNFTLDACASDWNYKVNNYYTEEDNGLEQPWTGVVWCNPPYGRQIKDWIRKGYESAQQGATVVMLIPARTDTAYWHEYVMKGRITFLRGHIKFIQPDGTEGNAAPFPSAIVVFQ